MGIWSMTAWLRASVTGRRSHVIWACASWCILSLHVWPSVSSGTDQNVPAGVGERRWLCIQSVDGIQLIVRRHHPRYDMECHS